MGLHKYRVWRVFLSSLCHIYLSSKNLYYLPIRKGRGAHLNTYEDEAFISGSNIMEEALARKSHPLQESKTTSTRTSVIPLTKSHTFLPQMLSLSWLNQTLWRKSLTWMPYLHVRISTYHSCLRISTYHSCLHPEYYLCYLYSKHHICYLYIQSIASAAYIRSFVSTSTSLHWLTFQIRLAYKYSTQAWRTIVILAFLYHYIITDIICIILLLPSTYVTLLLVCHIIMLLTSL